MKKGQEERDCPFFLSLFEKRSSRLSRRGRSLGFESLSHRGTRDQVEPCTKSKSDELAYGSVGELEGSSDFQVSGDHEGWYESEVFGTALLELSSAVNGNAGGIRLIGGEKEHVSDRYGLNFTCPFLGIEVIANDR